MTKHYVVATIPGDGIGPEVLRAAIRVVEAAVASVGGVSIAWRESDLGAERFRRTGVTLPDEVVADCCQADAVLLAAIGLPDVRLADGTEVQPEVMVGLRRVLGLYAAVRPLRLYPGVASPLRDVGQGIDCVIVRENLEGLFASFGKGTLANDALATDTLVISRSGTEKVVDFAFRLAERRQGRPLDGRRLVTCVDKSNVFRSYAFFRRVFFEVAQRYPQIAAEAIYVDAASLLLVQSPQQFDVLVMENQFGDILSDLGAALVGGLGLAPSAELGDRHGLFQPSHGTAPQLAGRNVANPTATILSAAMMFDWLSTQHQDPLAAEVARRMHGAVERALAAGTHLPADLGGRASTSDVAAAVIDCL